MQNVIYCFNPSMQNVIYHSNPVVFNLGLRTPRGVINHFWRGCNRSGVAKCSSSNLCMQLFKLCDNLYICFLLFIYIAKCWNII